MACLSAGVDRRYQVFVSSTFLDLQEERAAIVAALLQLDAIPAGMELFPAADDDAWTLIQRVIAASDYYVLVIGGRYGSIDSASDVGFTEKEFDFAIAQGKPVMAFLHGAPDEIPQGKAEKSEVAQAKLEAFRSKVQAQKHVKFWTSPDDLSGKVALSFANFTKAYPAIGWIRGDAQTAAESLLELNDLRKQVADLEKQLEAVRVGPPPGIDHLSQGDDPCGFKLAYTTTATIEPGGYRDTLTGAIPLTATWDRLFSAVGPHLLDEVEQKALFRQLNEWLNERYRLVARRAAIRQVNERDPEESIRTSRTVVSLSQEDFGTLIVQLKALGLVARSSRRRSVNDKGAYWTLTAYGDEHLTTLRAISRKPAEEPEGEEEGEEE